jgi:hypothetical protein
MKYRVSRIDNLVYEITKRIQKKYFSRINWSSLLNEFAWKYFLEHFPEEVEEVKREQENQCD